MSIILLGVIDREGLPIRSIGNVDVLIWKRLVQNEIVL